MPYSEIINEITSKLTGDTYTDLNVLFEESEKYKNHEYALEINRAIGRIIFKILPEERRQEAEQIFNRLNLSSENILQEAKLKITEKKLDEAEELLKSILPTEGMYREDAASIYFAFNEPMEEIIYKFKFKPHKEIRIHPEANTNIFFHYAYVLVEKKEYAEALQMLDKGLEYNPLDLRLLFEKCEIFKVQKDWGALREMMDLCWEYSFRPADVAKVYRNYGYLHIEYQDYDAAICCYLLSGQFEQHQMAMSQLFYISKISGKEVDPGHYFEHMEEILRESGLPFGPSEDVSSIAYTLGSQHEEEENNEAARYFFTILFDLTKDPEIGERLRDY